MIGRLNHVAIAVPDLEAAETAKNEALARFEDLQSRVAADNSLQGELNAAGTEYGQLNNAFFGVQNEMNELNSRITTL